MSRDVPPRPKRGECWPRRGGARRGLADAAPPHGEAGLHRDGRAGKSQRVESACFLNPDIASGTCSRRRTVYAASPKRAWIPSVRRRGALRDPGRFSRRILICSPGVEPEVADVAYALLARIREHARLARELSTEKVALLKMRTIVPRYSPAHRRFETAQGGYHCLPELGRFLKKRCAHSRLEKVLPSDLVYFPQSVVYR